MAAVAAGLAVLAGGIWWRLGNGGHWRALARPGTERFLRSRPEILALGRRYLRLEPGEASADRLAVLIEDALRRDPGAVVSEFRNGDVVILDGWVLSRTEARQCALSALLDA